VIDEPPSAQTHSRIYTGPQTDISQTQSKFLIYFNYPDRAVLNHVSTAAKEIIDTLDILSSD